MRFEPHNALRNILRQFENFKIYKGLYGKPLKRVTGWQELFSHTNPSYSGLPLRSLLLRYTAKNLQVT